MNNLDLEKFTTIKTLFSRDYVKRNLKSLYVLGVGLFALLFFLYLTNKEKDTNVLLQEFSSKTFTEQIHLVDSLIAGKQPYLVEKSLFKSVYISGSPNLEFKTLTSLFQINGIQSRTYVTANTQSRRRALLSKTENDDWQIDTAKVSGIVPSIRSIVSFENQIYASTRLNNTDIVLSKSVNNEWVPENIPLQINFIRGLWTNDEYLYCTASNSQGEIIMRKNAAQQWEKDSINVEVDYIEKITGYEDETFAIGSTETEDSEEYFILRRRKRGHWVKEQIPSNIDYITDIWSNQSGHFFSADYDNTQANNSIVFKRSVDGLWLPEQVDNIDPYTIDLWDEERGVFIIGSNSAGIPKLLHRKGDNSWSNALPSFALSGINNVWLDSTATLISGIDANGEGIILKRTSDSDWIREKIEVKTTNVRQIWGNGVDTYALVDLNIGKNRLPFILERTSSEEWIVSFMNLDWKYILNQAKISHEIRQDSVTFFFILSLVLSMVGFNLLPDKKSMKSERTKSESNSQVELDLENHKDLLQYLNKKCEESGELAYDIKGSSRNYLIAGIGIALLGIAVFYFWPVYSPGSFLIAENAINTDSTHKYDQYIEVTIYFLQRAGVLLFIEYIAFFFLRQYRVSMEDFRYYENIKRSRENILALVSLTTTHKNHKALINNLNQIFQLENDNISPQTDPNNATNPLSNNQMELIKHVFSKSIEILKPTK